MVTNLGSLELVLCASPAYLSRHGAPRDANALAAHEFVLCEQLPWQACAPDEFRHLEPRSRLTTNDLLIARQTTIDGLGITLLPHLVVARHLEHGNLIPVLPDCIGSMPLWMLTPRVAQLSRRTEVLVTFLKTQLAQSAPWNYPGSNQPP